MDVEFVQKVLDYWQRQREDRERKCQDEQEFQAAYAARMQAQYGIEITQRGRKAEAQRGKLVQVSPLHPCTPAPMPSSSLSTPPKHEDGSNNRLGMDIEAELSDSWWERVKYYARLAIERVECGVDAVKELLSTLTIDERCGVMLEFEDASPPPPLHLLFPWTKEILYLLKLLIFLMDGRVVYSISHKRRSFFVPILPLILVSSSRLLLIRILQNLSLSFSKKSDLYLKGKALLEGLRQ
ncbi:MAG: hypothetical protein V7K89_24915 [Nostoc sp.]|uniref:hypothetical protein n=1 Tax=Nostoc sp. TaxID=1180 RepID=UPI002FF61AEF